MTGPERVRHWRLWSACGMGPGVNSQGKCIVKVAHHDLVGHFERHYLLLQRSSCCHSTWDQTWFVWTGSMSVQVSASRDVQSSVALYSDGACEVAVSNVLGSGCAPRCCGFHITEWQEALVFQS
eukprot:2947737-Amphidinium_carterae.1